MLLAGCSRRICNDVANGPRTDAAYACMVGAPVVNVKKELPVFDLLVVKFHLVCEIVQELPRPAASSLKSTCLRQYIAGPTAPLPIQAARASEYRAIQCAVVGVPDAQLAWCPPQVIMNAAISSGFFAA